MSHFVYIYRDASGKACYIGYGQSNAEAFENMAQTHNKRLRELVNSKTLTLEIAGPFDSQATALAVETALLSAIVPGAISARGQTIHRFRPLGVPPQFAQRFALFDLMSTDAFHAHKWRKLRPKSYRSIVKLNYYGFNLRRAGISMRRS